MPRLPQPKRGNNEARPRLVKDPAYDNFQRTMADDASGHEYKAEFYEYINAGSLSSARVICPLIVRWLKPASVLDVGSGAGAWCKVWGETGVSEVLAVDGDYVDRRALLVPESSFRAQDLSLSFDLGRQFALVTSLEVAEHVSKQAARTFVENLARHGDVVLFSAAVPGQGGEFHVNEQPLAFWKDHFASLGFRCFDALRPEIAANRAVEPWYRYNTLLYVRGDAIASLPSQILAREVAPSGVPAELAPVTWRLRNAIVRVLPSPLVKALVGAKHSWTRRARQT